MGSYFNGSKYATGHVATVEEGADAVEDVDLLGRNDEFQRDELVPDVALVDEGADAVENVDLLGRNGIVFQRIELRIATKSSSEYGLYEGEATYTMST